jgi:hypothetical protein
LKSWRKDFDLPGYVAEEGNRRDPATVQPGGQEIYGITDFNHHLDDLVRIKKDHTDYLSLWERMGPQEFKDGNPLKGESHGFKNPGGLHGFLKKAASKCL